MKQVIFLCLLSLTLCLSKPAETEVPANHEPVKTATEAKAKTNLPSPTTVPAQTQVTTKQTSAAEQPPNPSIAPHVPEENKAQNTTAPIDNNKTTEKKEEATTAKTNEAKVETSTIAVISSTEAKPATEKKPEEKGSKDVTTIAPPKSTEAAQTSAAPKDEDKHVVQARGFDGPSFIGGIILSLGLLAIGFMGFKYYKNQTERNYHTL